MRGIALIEMDTALHDGDRYSADGADHKRAGVPDGSTDGEARNLGVRKSYSVLEFVGEGAETGAEDERDSGAQSRTTQNVARGLVGKRELVGDGHRCS